MLLTITFLVVAVLHPAQPTQVANLHQPTVNLIQLRPAQPTIVKTWEIK